MVVFHILIVSVNNFLLAISDDYYFLVIHDLSGNGLSMKFNILFIVSVNKI